MKNKIIKNLKDEKDLKLNKSTSKSKKLEDKKIKEEVCEFCNGTGGALFWNCPVCCDSVF